MDPEGARRDDIPLPKGGVIENFEVPVETYEWLKKRAAYNNRTVEMEINELIIEFAKTHAISPVATDSTETSKSEMPTRPHSPGKATKR